jgi:intracellular sulfur oxidation DsrE/DsrF family protein
MRIFYNAIKASAVYAMALLLAVAPAAAQDRNPVPKVHRLVLQVNSNDLAMMTLALNNATNVEQYYTSRGEKVDIEVVTFGSGLHMLREDTSPVKLRIKAISERTSSISFKACGNTQENMRKAENKDIPLLKEATVVESGVVRLLERQEQGWAYVRP